MALFSVCSVYEGCRLVFLFYLFIFCVTWRCVACSVYGALGWDPCSVYSVSNFFIGHWGWTFVALFSVCSVYGACRLVCLLYLFFLCVWRGVACSVYGALGWGACGVHSVCSVYEAFGLVAFFAAFIVFLTFMGHWSGTLVAFTVFVLFMECWGWTFVAFTAFVAFIGRSDRSFWWRLDC